MNLIKIGVALIISELFAVNAKVNGNLNTELLIIIIICFATKNITKPIERNSKYMDKAASERMQ